MVYLSVKLHRGETLELVSYKVRVVGGRDVVAAEGLVKVIGSAA